MARKSKIFDSGMLFDMMPMPRMIVDVVDGKPQEIIECNQYAAKYFNIEKNRIIGEKISDFTNPENARHFEQSFQVSVSRNRVVTIPTLPIITEGLKIHSFSVTPIHDEDNNILYLDVLGQPDVRDQSALQRERDDAVSLLASIFEVSEVGIIVTDEKGSIVRVNDSFIRTYGWPRDEIVGQDFITLVTDDEKERTRINHKKFISVGVRSTGEVKMIRKDGNIANVLFTSATLRLSQNRKFLVTTVMDISLRKQMENSLFLAKEQADSANRAKSNFLANMSHELRTPLNAIIGFSELIMKETFGPIGTEKYSEYMDDIHMSAEHLLEIINEVLDMSKIEAGRLELSEDSFSIYDTIVSVCRMMSSRVFASNIDIITTIEGLLPPINADYRLIRQVLINLITNAIKFSPQGSKITVFASITPQNEMIIKVSDQGIGIPEDKIARALEPFGQVDERSDMRDLTRQGTGLGLPLAKAMAEMHGGKLGIESEVDIGTTVWFTIPTKRLILEDEPSTNN